jgi:predicted dehydrogenase
VSASDAIRIGFIGVGGRARSHLRAVSTVDGAEIVAIADIDGARARAVAEEYGAPAYESAAEMLDAQTLDAVWIVTPPAFHRAPFVEAAKRGVHVYVEKPVALNMTDALAMEEAADQAGILAAVSYQIRYLDTVAEVHRTFESRDLALLNAHYYWQSPGRWQLDTALSGGQIVEQATHLADLMRYWAGDVETVHAAYTLRTRKGDENFRTWDANTVNLVFASGAVGSLVSTYALFAGVPENVRIDLIAGELLARFTYRDLHIYSRSESRGMDATVQPDEAAAAAFIHAVRTGDSTGILTPLSDSNRTLAVTLAANESAVTGQPVDVNDFIKMHSPSGG